MGTKKRILVFIPQFPNLTETFIEREIAKMAERDNVDVSVFSLKEGGGAYSDSLKDRVFYERFSLNDFGRFLSYLFSNFPHVLKVFREFKDLKKTGISEKSENYPSAFKEIYTFFKSVAYAEKFQRLKPDIILGHFLSEPSTIVMHVSKLLNIPYAISAHARDIMVSGEYIREKVSSASFIVICNKNAYDYVLEKSKGLDTSNIYLSYHGIDVDKIIKTSENKDFRPEKSYILWVGRLVEKKGLKYLIEAISMLKDRGSHITLNIIGYGPLKSDICEMIKKFGLEDAVKILGDYKGLSNEETLLYFKSAKLYAFPSIETDEGDVDGVANVLLEAGAFRLPVISTEAGGTGELIVNEETGIVVPQKDPSSLADGIDTLLNDEDLSLRLGESLHKKVLEKFDLDKNIIWLEDMLIKNARNINL